MTDDANMLDCVAGFYYLGNSIEILESCRGFEPKELREIEQYTIRLHNLLRKHRSNHATR